MIPKAPRALGFTVTGESNGPAVLFLHGFLGSSGDWRGLSSALEARFRCVAVDLPGHGASLELSPDRYTMEGTARSVLEVLDDSGLKRAAFVGYSMGGRLALYLALRHPERCAGLFLESASPGLEGSEERADRRRADGKLAERLESGDFGLFVRDWYRQPLFAPLARNEALLRRTLAERLKNDPAELARSLRGMGTGSQPSLWDELPDLRMPTLAVAGDLDEKFVGISRRMERLCPRVRTVVFPGAGHNVHAEAPEEYLALLSRFLEDVPIAARSSRTDLPGA